MRASETIDRLKTEIAWRERAIKTLQTMQEGRIRKCEFYGDIYRVCDDLVQYWDEATREWRAAPQGVKFFGTGNWGCVSSRSAPKEGQHPKDTIVDIKRGLEGVRLALEAVIEGTLNRP